MNTPSYESIARHFEQFIPYGTLPTDDMFYGVNRAVDARLAGQYFDATHIDDPEDYFVQASARVEMQGSELTAFLIHPKHPTSVDMMMTPCGKVSLIRCSGVPKDRAFGINLDSWKTTDKALIFPIIYTNPTADSTRAGQRLSFCCRAIEGCSATFSYQPAFCVKPIANINIRIKATV